MERGGDGGFEPLETIQALPQGILRLSGDGEITFVNAAGEDLLGLSPGEWKGRNFLEVVSLFGGEGRTQPIDLHVVLDHLRTGRCWCREDSWIVRSDDREIPASYVFAPVLKEGRIEGAVFSFRDLTERRRAERALHEARVEIAAAGKAQAAKTAFFHSVSRDLLGPVDVLVGAAERLAAGDLPPAARAEVETVRGAARTVLGVLADLLDWARIESGLLEIVPLEFDLPSAMTEVLDCARPGATAKGLTLELRSSLDGATRVRGDAGRIRQIATKLLDNALRLATEGPVTLEVAVTWRSRTDAMVRVSVTHRRAGAAPARETAGPAGLADGAPRHGVALAQRLVERMGGASGTESSDGTATSWFELKLPLAATGPRRLRAADLRGVRALVIDSSDSGRDALARQLAAAGVRCTATGSGGQALRLLRSALEQWDPYRIAILSAPLREMDAATLGDLVKGDPRLRDTALVYLATVGEPGDARRLEAIGFSAYLVKPVSDAVLRDALAVVYGASVVHAETGLVTRHALRDSRIIQLTPDEIRDRAERVGREGAVVERTAAGRSVD